MDSNCEIDYEYLPFLRVYKDGHVERLLSTATVSPSIDPHTGVSSKDVLIKPDGTVSGRLYLPSTLTQTSPKLPILVYFHGGGFMIESTSSLTYHTYLNSLVSKARVVAVSVEYRRAPEHPLPTAYDDSWAALQWVAAHADSSVESPEIWLTKHADFRRLFLAGDSAGANIAHHMAIRAGLLNHGAAIHGIVLIQPYFWGSKPIGSEGSDPAAKAVVDKMWSFVCPSGPDVDDNDHPFINPVAPSSPSLSGLGCSRVLICVAEKDVLRDRGWVYFDALSKSGWGGVVEMLESEGENHVFHLFNSDSENAKVMMERVASFLQRQ